MPELTPDELRRMLAGLKASTQSGVNNLLIDQFKRADAIGPGFRFEVVCSAMVTTMSNMHRALSAVNNEPFTPDPDRVMATAIVSARYIAEKAGLEGFDLVAEWQRALADVERLKEPKQ